jgi:hypothetical protein
MATNYVASFNEGHPFFLCGFWGGGGGGGVKAKSSQALDMFPKKFPNSTSLLSHML